MRHSGTCGFAFTYLQHFQERCCHEACFIQNMWRRRAERSGVEWNGEERTRQDRTRTPEAAACPIITRTPADCQDKIIGTETLSRYWELHHAPGDRCVMSSSELLACGLGIFMAFLVERGAK